MNTRAQKLIIYFGVLFIFLTTSFDCFAQNKLFEYNYETPQVLPVVKAKLAGHDFNVLLARTNQQKSKGLMFYREIPEDTGMLFVYNNDHIMSFWMKNTRIPLDLVFLSSDLKVTEWITNMIPGYGKKEYLLPHYTSKNPARHAIELKAGTVEKLGIKIGDKLEIPLMLLYSE